MNDTQPHVGDYWTRKSDGTRVQVNRVWLNLDQVPAVAYDIFNVADHTGRITKTHSALGLDLFRELYAPEAPAHYLTEDDVRRIVREELAAVQAEKAAAQAAMDLAMLRYMHPKDT